MGRLPLDAEELWGDVGRCKGRYGERATSLSMLKSLSSEARCCSPLRRSCRPVYFSASSFCFFMLFWLGVGVGLGSVLGLGLRLRLRLRLRLGVGLGLG